MRIVLKQAVQQSKISLTPTFWLWDGGCGGGCGGCTGTGGACRFATGLLLWFYIMKTCNSHSGKTPQRNEDN